jgi:hypothetical protein
MPEAQAPLTFPNGVPYTGRRPVGAGMTPLAPSKAFTPMQEKRLAILVGNATAPLVKEIEALKKRLDASEPKPEPKAAATVVKVATEPAAKVQPAGIAIPTALAKIIALAPNQNVARALTAMARTDTPEAVRKTQMEALLRKHAADK